uniref:Replication initiator protein n=1 Tax=Dulem virus 208 TaxID=3145685 RepID=A0AAU8BAQ2_9VIRU
MCLAPRLIKSKTKGSENYIGSLYFSDERGEPCTFVPCGKCVECKNLYIEQWQIRWKEQIKDSLENSCYMLTLTYNEENLPRAVVDEVTGEVISDVTTLRYSDVTKFIKRLRKRQDKYIKDNKLQPVSIKYHYCGEYGTKFTKRPHYHMIITNVILPINGIGNFKNNTFNDIWKNGNVHIGTDITDKSLRYILKYTLKNVYKCDEKETVKELKKVKREYCADVSFDVPKFRYYTREQIVKYWRERLEGNKILYFDMPFNASDDKGLEKFAIDFLEQKKKEVEEREELYEIRNICTIYKKGINKGRIVEKAFCSKGIGKCYLTEKNIYYHKQNLNLGYMDYEEKKGFKERPLPRYYRDHIFNPILNTEEKRDYFISKGVVPDEENMKRQIRKYRENDDNYQETLVYKKRLIMFMRNVQDGLTMKETIDKVGYQQYYTEREAYLSVKNHGYMSNLEKYFAGVSRREPEFVC